MRGVDLSIFDFDYDLQWFAMMLTPDGETLGRYGSPSKDRSLAGLRHSLERASERFKIVKDRKPDVQRKPSYAESYPAAEKRAAGACIHCHHVYEFRRDKLQRDGRWSLDEVWVYPEPENLGL